MSAGPEVQTLQAGALRMRVATQGSGPLVLLCHGFPELWCSWRAQMAALAGAGFRAAAPDMRQPTPRSTRCFTTWATWWRWCRRWARSRPW